jgi:hypothetical protein
MDELKSITPPEREGVYFLQQGDRIKIGYSTNIRKRARGDAFASHPVRLVAWVPGTLTRERELHQQFGDLRVHGEWFRLDDTLVEFIKTKQPKEKKIVNPTKRQIASVIRRTARVLPEYPRMTAALYEVCAKHGSKASTYYDAAVRTIKAYTPVRFSELLRYPTSDLEKTMRRAARALEHGLQIDV